MLVFLSICDSALSVNVALSSEVFDPPRYRQVSRPPGAHLHPTRIYHKAYLPTYFQHVPLPEIFHPHPAQPTTILSPSSRVSILRLPSRNCPPNHLSTKSLSSHSNLHSPGALLLPASVWIPGVASTHTSTCPRRHPERDQIWDHWRDSDACQTFSVQLGGRVREGIHSAWLWFVTALQASDRKSVKHARHLLGSEILTSLKDTGSLPPGWGMTPPPPKAPAPRDPALASSQPDTQPDANTGGNAGPGAADNLSPAQSTPLASSSDDTPPASGSSTDKAPPPPLQPTCEDESEPRNEDQIPGASAGDLPKEGQGASGNGAKKDG